MVPHAARSCFAGLRADVRPWRVLPGSGACSQRGGHVAKGRSRSQGGGRGAGWCYPRIGPGYTPIRDRTRRCAPHPTHSHAPPPRSHVSNRNSPGLRPASCGQRADADSKGHQATRLYLPAGRATWSRASRRSARADRITARTLRRPDDWVYIAANIAGKYTQSSRRPPKSSRRPLKRRITARKEGFADAATWEYPGRLWLGGSPFPRPARGRGRVRPGCGRAGRPRRGPSRPASGWW